MTHALIAIAEQLERMISGVPQLDQAAVKDGLYELHRMCESIPDGDGSAEDLDQLVTDIYEKIDGVLCEFPDEEEK